MRFARSSRIVALSATVALIAGGLSTSQADERDDLIRKQRQQEQQIQNLQSSLEGVNVDLQKTYVKLEETKAQIPGVQAELLVAQGELAAAQREQEQVAARLDAAKGELGTITTQIADGEAQLNETKDSLASIARAEYRGDNKISTIDLLVGAKSSDDFFNSLTASQAVHRIQSQTLTTVSQTTAGNKTRQRRQKAVEQTIGELKAEADKVVQTKAAKEAETSAKKAALEQLESSVTAQTVALESLKGEFQSSISSMNAAKNDTVAEIARIDEEAARQRAAANSGGGGQSGGGAPAPSGALIPPIPQPLVVTSPYGMRWYPFGGYFFHQGVDLRSACGNPQVAAASGTVASVRGAYGNDTHGNQIFINHGVIGGSSYITVYNHLSGFAVRVGQRVSQGQVIGYTGATGMVTGCHVHFEVWKNGDTINPMGLPGF